MEIVDLILKGKLTRVARRAGVAGYAAALVDVEEVRSHVRGPAADGLTGRQVMVELGTFHAVVRALIDEGHLPTRRAINPLNRTPVKLVDRADLDTFRRTYVPLSELAKKRRVHPRTIRVELEAKGIKPALDQTSVEQDAERLQMTGRRPTITTSPRRRGLFRSGSKVFPH